MAKRKSSKVDRPVSPYERNWEQVESLPLEGKRYPLQYGRLFKVQHQRGWFRVHKIYQNKQDPTHYEVHAWWRDKKLFTQGRAMWRFVRPEQIKHITGTLEGV